MGSIFVLSGEDYTFPSAEIRALVETYSPSSICENLSTRIIHSDLNDTNLISKINQRGAYCRFGGWLLSKGSSIEQLSEIIGSETIETGKTFVVDSETLDRPICADLGALIKAKTNASVSLENPDIVFQLESTGREMVLGMSKDGLKTFTWRQRRPRARKFFLPSAIFPKLACLLVNLSRVKEDEYFLDPFCGTGSLLIESCLMGVNTLGFDLTRWIARGAQMNLKGFSIENGGVVRADSTNSHLPLRFVDAIATDVPYGRASSTKGKETKTIIKEFTKAAAEILSASDDTLKRSKYCVLMRPSEIEFDYDESAFELCEEHFLYVHRTLTRAISVLRRRS
ncbi:MAG: THUMP domain-containing protein [Thaumarchaeota archaeon]|nr:THUMP domain-containing protein [Nitrososphaerota archaeon]